MIPQKYKFYIARKLSIYVNYGFVINSSTGELEYQNRDYSVTDRIAVTDFNSIKLLKPIYVACSLGEYNKSNKLIKLTALADDSLFELDSNTKFIKLQFYKLDGTTIFTDLVAGAKSVNPHYKELSKKYSKENNQEFFRISLDGKMSVFGRDYEFVKNSSLEDQLLFYIYKYNKNWYNYFTGEFSKTDCKLDYDKRSCELKITPYDAYSNILNKYENNYDLIKLAPALSKINITKRSLMQVYILGANSITNLFGGIYWESDINEVVEDNKKLENTYHFSYIMAANEFEIRGRVSDDIKGVYAGTKGSYDNSKGYSIYAEYDKSTVGLTTRSGYLIIKNTKDNIDLYKSEAVTLGGSGVDGDIWIDTNSYFSKDQIRFEPISGIGFGCVMTNIFTYRVFQRLLCDVDTVESTEGTLNTYKLESDDFVTDNKNYKRCIGLKGGLFFCTSYTVDKPTKYGTNDFNKYFTNKFLPSISGLGRAIPIGRSSWTNASLWYVYDDNLYRNFEMQLRKQYVLKDTFSIAEVIKVLLKEIDPSITHEATSEYSRFLYDTEVPIIMERFYVYITQKTNVLKGDYDTAAKKAETSLKEIMDMLRDCFRCYWYIENNKFKIEHISFFMQGGSYTENDNIQLDFTTLKDKFNKKRIDYFQTSIEYDKTDLNQRYEFAWMDDVTDLFGNVTIDVNSNYIQKDKSEDISISNFSSDVDYMLFNPSSFSNDGFALLCPIKNNDILELPIVETGLIDEDKREYTAIIQNFYASWVYLINFYMYDMPAKNIDCNKVKNLVARNIKACLKHEITFQSEEDLDERALIKTSIGQGIIDEVSINIDTRTVRAKLLYKPK